MSNVEKCRLLVARLRGQSEPQYVPISEFFDGNDDIASIGCNLSEHPGVEKFRNVLESILARADVSAVLAEITELEPGVDEWPFSDAVYVLGSASQEAIAKSVAGLYPDEVASVERSWAPATLPKFGEERVLRVWWD